MGTDKGFDHVDWSYSTSRVYHTCPRQFFYKESRSDEDSTDGDDAAASSSSMPPPGAFIGTVVHDCIENQIERWRVDEPLSLLDAQSAATGRIKAYVTENEETLRSVFSPDPDEFDAEDRARSLIRTVHNHIETYFQVIWPEFHAHHYILHEETFSFQVGRQTVWVRPDLCTRDETGNFVISDWKTTQPDLLSEPSSQVLVYALWAQREYEPDLDRILVQLMHTSTGERDRYHPDQNDLNRVTKRIIDDSELWATHTSRSEYPPDPEQDKCTQCSYLSRCDAGQDVAACHRTAGMDQMR